MKTRKQKVISILACVFLLASFFAIPVSASDEFYTAIFNYPAFLESTSGAGWQYSAGLCSTEEYLNNGLYWNFYNPDSQTFYDNQGAAFEFTYPDGFNNRGYTSVYVGASSFGTNSYGKSDTCWVDPFTLVFSTSTTGQRYTKFRIALRKIEGQYWDITSCLGYSDWISVDVGRVANTLYEISFDRTKINMVDSADCEGVAVFIDFYGTCTRSSFMFDVWEDHLTLHYGQGISPNYPIYTTPDSGDLGNLESAEGQLMDSNTAGLDAANNSFLSFVDNMLAFGLVFGRISMMLNRFVGGVPLLSVLVTISLSLGLFASLLGLAAAIVGAADRKAGREARQSRKEKK